MTLEKLVKSPIELSLVEAIQRVFTSENIDVVIHHNDTAWKKIPDVSPYTVLHKYNLAVLMPQLPVGRYRGDIVIGMVAYDFDCSGEHPVEVSRKLPLLVVECDGHEFHQKTKEQAAHDHERDRWMNTNGYRVLRFTGSEIYRDADRCAIQLVEFFYSNGMQP